MVISHNYKNTKKLDHRSKTHIGVVDDCLFVLRVFISTSYLFINFTLTSSFFSEKKTFFLKMKLFNLFVATTVALNLPEGLTEEKDEANSILR